MEGFIGIATGLLCILSFVIGARVGQKSVKNDEIKLPSINPVKIINEMNESREQKKEQERYKIIAENIDNYDGTSIGQKDVPK